MYSITEYVHNFYSIFNFPNPHIKSLFLWSDLTVVLRIGRFLGGVEKADISGFLDCGQFGFCVIIVTSC